MTGFSKAKILRNKGKEWVSKKFKIERVIIEPSDILDDSFMKCNFCKETIKKDKVKKNLFVCTSCNTPLRIDSSTRINITFDSFKELFSNIVSVDPLKLDSYKEKLKVVKLKTGDNSAVRVGIAIIKDQKMVSFVMNSEFIMGSLGSAMGEKITKAFEYASDHKLPVVAFVASGGARMQEGMFSLMQMAKTSAALGQFQEKGGFFMPILTSPTYGGVSASFAMLGDIIIAEEKALIGFAGKKVIANAMKKELPEGFQTAEFLLERGFVDLITTRDSVRDNIQQILSMHNFKKIKAGK